MTMHTRKVLVGEVADVDRKGSRTIRVDELEIALFRLSDGQILAVENKCPHKGGLLSEGMVCGTKVHCPLHDWRIDLVSGRVQDPDTGCVRTFPVAIDAERGLIYLTLQYA
ncbi:nitrite reductase small subunit NirD [Paenibacillus sp. JX-17]|uniref:Nitrite reductase small subunit NirD n=1 Tax=Paenibacillus lacisoli TaxID=3064525 RepID=A0ABT9CJC2_9BACL|nr:nitrite reductase small subunit NirD [Paenibacillus sp. JX-17]MDO7907766.1 nitrite reductase small subunit NirD [Paenibacillus sp. JX-17]